MFKHINNIEAAFIGFLIGVTSPDSLGGVTHGVWWAYMVLMAILLNSMYSTIKGWIIRRAEKDDSS